MNKKTENIVKTTGQANIYSNHLLYGYGLFYSIFYSMFKYFIQCVNFIYFLYPYTLLIYIIIILIILW